MRRKQRTLDKIQEAFADAVAAGEFDRAEGWLAISSWAAGSSAVAGAPQPAATR